MATTFNIIDNGTTIQLIKTVNGKDLLFEFNKLNTAITCGDCFVSISDLRGTERFKYEEVVTPVTADIKDLSDTLQGWLETYSTDVLDAILAAVSAGGDGCCQGDTGAGTTINQNAASVLLLSANADRKEAFIRNDAQGSQTLYIALGATATTSAAIALGKGDIFILDSYTGVVSGIWSAAGSGTAEITEVDV